MDISSKEIVGCIIKIVAVFGAVTLCYLFYGEIFVEMALDGYYLYLDHLNAFFDYWEGG